MPAIPERIRQFLTRPYPYYFEGRSLWILLVLLAVMGVVFQYFFQPFDVNLKEHRMPFFWITVMHTAVALLIVLLASLVVRIVRIQTESWMVWKDILFLGMVLLAIGFGQFLIRDLIYDNPNNWSVGYLLEEIRNTFLIGMLFVMILVPFNQNRLYRRNTERARDLSRNAIRAESGPSIQIHTQLKQDDFELDPASLLFAKADRNYVEVHMLENGALRKSLKRISLRSLEEQLDSISYIVKTHRSYLVNLQFLESVSGNAQGYHLKMKYLDTPILVSRALIPSFERRLRQVS